MSSFITESIYNIEKMNDIINLIKKLNKSLEFEVSINQKYGITISQYLDIVKYLIKISNKNVIIEDSLDISYNNYRISVYEIDYINQIISNISRRSNHTIFSILANNILNQENNKIKIINKIKNPKNIIDILEYDLRIRLSEEKKIDNQEIKKLTILEETERNKIFYRYKHRLSYLVKCKKDFDIRIDITEIRQHTTINKLNNSQKKYELEVEIIQHTNIIDTTIVYNLLFFEIYKLQCILQKSNKIITISEKEIVVKQMKKLLLFNVNNESKDLPGMQSVSLENQHVASDITTQYSVTDKADGERYFLMIYNQKLFLISNNLDVKELKLEKYNINNYDNTIIDGEYVYLPDYNKYLFLAFDILMIAGIDVRPELILENRLIQLGTVLKECFNVENTYIKIPTTINNISEILEFYKRTIIKHFNELNLKLQNNNIVIMGKIFIIPLGLYNSEIYAYSDLIWSLYTSNTMIKCPYNLDGMIYTPLKQKYTRITKEIKYQIYKWKPPSHNSIDFYIEFVKNEETGQILNVYDNSYGVDFEDAIEYNKIDKNDSGTLDDETKYKVNNSIYRICNLYVGSNNNNIEQPIPFGKEYNLNIAHLYIKDNEVRDIENNIIQDKTVVEFSYNNNPLLPHPFRWIALRTRYDKTEFVYKYKRKYGNNEKIANKIWNSIMLPFTINDIKILADENKYVSYMNNNIKTRITKEDIVKERSSNIYYQIQTSLTTPMRNFHNFIKSNIIFIYCREKTRKLDHLEIGMGRGGELLKLYHAKVNSIVGLDVDYEGIYSATDGVISRYTTMKRKMPNFPKSTFLIADAGIKLNYVDQEKSMGIISEENKKTIQKIFGNNDVDKEHSTFDIFSCQFMLHYLFKTNETWNNFCYNINKYLNKNGYLLITTLDGNLIHKSFINNKITQYYTDNGKKKKLFEFVKLYNETDISQTGLAIDYFNASFMMENSYRTEYIIEPNFLIRQLETNCNMILIDTDSFENQFYVHKHFFENIIKYEANNKTKKFFENIKEFYNFDDEINKNSFELTKLHRYFIFQKIK